MFHLSEKCEVDRRFEHMIGPVANGTLDGFTRSVWMAMLATMIGTSGQLGYALGVMNAPCEVGTVHAHFGLRSAA